MKRTALFPCNHIRNHNSCLAIDRWAAVILPRVYRVCPGQVEASVCLLKTGPSTVMGKL